MPGYYKKHWIIGYYSYDESIYFSRHCLDKPSVIVSYIYIFFFFVWETIAYVSNGDLDGGLSYAAVGNHSWQFFIFFFKWSVVRKCIKFAAITYEVDQGNMNQTSCFVQLKIAGRR